MKLYSAVILDGEGFSPKVAEAILALSSVEIYKKLPKVKQIPSIENAVKH